MLSHPPHLSILRPSPCTTQFTVSTASPLETFSSRLWNYFTFLMRALLLCSTILVLLCKTFPPPPISALNSKSNANSNSNSNSNSAHPWRATINPPFLAERIAPVPWTFLAPILLLGFFLVFRRFYAEESLLTLRSLGIQTRSLSPYYLFPAATRFIPTSQIVDIFIHEAFRGFEVRYYLAVVVEGEGAVVVVFPKLLPCRAIVEHVWRGARECLYEPKSPPTPTPTPKPPPTAAAAAVAAAAVAAAIHPTEMEI